MDPPCISKADLQSILGIKQKNETKKHKKSAIGMKASTVTVSKTETKIVPSNISKDHSPSGVSTPEEPSTSEIIAKLQQRNRTTLRLRGLPLSVKPRTIDELAPEAQTYRLAWNSFKRKYQGAVLLEFKNEEDLQICNRRLNGMQFEKGTLVTQTGKFVPESLEHYDLKRLSLHGLHWRTKRGEIAQRFRACTSIDIPPEKRTEKKKLKVAFLTFPSVYDAFHALDSRHGCRIRGRKISVTWYLKREKVSENERNDLFISGLKECVTEADIQALFPQASTITLQSTNGQAHIQYEVEEDCLLDQQNAQGMKLYGRTIKIFRRPKLSHQLDRQTNMPVSSIASTLPAIYCYMFVDWKAVSIDLFPKYTAYLAYWVDVRNADDLYQSMVKREIPLLEGMHCTLLDGDYILDLVQLDAAITQALLHLTSGSMVTHQLATEVVFCLSPTRSLKQALATFSAKPTTRRLLVVIVFQQSDASARAVSKSTCRSTAGGDVTKCLDQIATLVRGTRTELMHLADIDVDQIMTVYNIGAVEKAYIDASPNPRGSGGQSSDENGGERSAACLTGCLIPTLSVCCDKLEPDGGPPFGGKSLS